MTDGIKRGPEKIFNGKYNLFSHLNVFSLFKHPDVLPPLRELLLLAPGSQEFLLDEIDQDILFKYLLNKNLMEDSKKLIKEEILSQWDGLNNNLIRDEVPVYYSGFEQKYFCFITLKENEKLNSFLNFIPQFKKDAILFEKRQKCTDQAKIILDFLPLPEVVSQMVINYLTDGKYLCALAQSLLAQLENLRQKYFNRSSRIFHRVRISSIHSSGHRR